MLESREGLRCNALGIQCFVKDLDANVLSKNLTAIFTQPGDLTNDILLMTLRVSFTRKHTGFNIFIFGASYF